MKLLLGAALLVIVLIGLLMQLGKTDRNAPGEPLVLYCAAGVKPAVLPLAQAFEREYGQAVQLMYGGSGTLLSNLQVARRGDLYIAADHSYIDLATEKGLIDETLPLAWQRPVIAVAKGNPKNIHTVEDLKRADIRLALGNPDAASIGKQTKQLLQSAGVWESIKAHVERNGVFKPTVPEVANAVKLGAVDAGVMWDGMLTQYPELEAVTLPVFDTARSQISVAVLKSSQQPTAALRFARYLNSTIGNAAFEARGYEVLEGDEWTWQPELTVFCAGVNRSVMDEVLQAFAEREGVWVTTVYHDCGLSTEQMQRSDQGNVADVASVADVSMACEHYDLDAIAERETVSASRVGSTDALEELSFRIARSSKYKCLGRRLCARVAASPARFENVGFHFHLGETQ